jgi:hypothetical protein
MLLVITALFSLLPAILFAQQGSIWIQATANAQWPTRAAHTSVVYNNNMWVMGGYYLRNDVWSSSDGINWTPATPNAQWSGRLYHTSVVFDNKMWVIGGWDGYSGRNDVWSSSDGINWTQATANAQWSARYQHTSVVFDNKMWVIGGFDISGFRNDVWSSSDGINWTQATANAQWSARYQHTSVVFDNRMWVIGGVDASAFRNDVWSSSEGINWTPATPNAQWSGRGGHTSVVFDNRMWVIGGSPNGSSGRNDVWSSSEGINWTPATPNAQWSARFIHTSVVYNNNMWVIGGYNAGTYFSDVWYSDTVAQIWVSPTSFSVTLSTGGNTTQTLTIGNSGNANLNWSLAEVPSVAWLSRSETIGTITPGNQTSVALTFSSAGLGPGTYNTTLAIVSNDPSSPTNVPVQLTVTVPQPGGNLPCRTYGTDSSERAHALVQNTDDGSYVMAGFTTGFPTTPFDTNLLIVKIDSSGNFLQAKISDGLLTEIATSMIRTSDSGYALTGWTTSYLPEDTNIFVIKLDPTLNVQWGYVYYNTEYKAEQAYSIIEVSPAQGGGYAVIGWTNMPVDTIYPPSTLVMRLFPNGAVRWVKLYNLWQRHEEGYDIVELPAPMGFAITGRRKYWSSTDWDAYVRRIDTEGYVIWSRAIPGIFVDWGYSIIFDGYIVAAGWTNSFPPQDSNIFVWKLNLAGDDVWRNVYGWPEGAELVMDEQSLLLTSDGNYAISGWTKSRGPGTRIPNPNPNFLIMKLASSDGSILWSRVHPSIPGAQSEEAYPIIQTINGGYAIAGWTNSFGVGQEDFHFLTLNDSGNRRKCVLDSTPDTGTFYTGPDPVIVFEKMFNIILIDLIDAMVQSVNVCPVDTLSYWVPIESMPTQVGGKYVKDGGSLVKVDGAKDGDILYAFRGNKSLEFYKYTNTWAYLLADSIPYGTKPPPDTLTINKKKVGKGASLGYDGSGIIYATKGNGTREFWSYAIGKGSWTQKAFVPVSKGLKGGTSIAYYDGKVYLLAGSQKKTDPNNFFAYDVATSTWTALASLELGPKLKVWKDGACITELNGTIYAMKSNDKPNKFYAYDTATNAWTAMETLPTFDSVGTKVKKLYVKDGGAMCAGGGSIYAIKGGGYNLFYKYTPTVGWEVLDTIVRLHKKSVPKTGAALAYANGKVYLLKGNNTPELWCYTPGTAYSKEQIAKSNLVGQGFSLANIYPFMLYQNSPNPFNSQTAIRYSIPRECNVSLSIYDITGKLVKTLVNEAMNAGVYSTSWNGNDNDGRKVGQGVYFYVLKTAGEKTQKKMLMLR